MVYSKKKNFDLYYNCHNQKHIFGTGFIVIKRIKHLVLDFIPVNERICVLRVKGKFFNLSIINAHAPTKDKDERIKDEFYETLERVYDCRPKNEIKILIGDLNAQIRRERIYQEYAGRHSVHEMTNDNGSRLMGLAASKRMFVGSTKFEHKKYTKSHGKDVAATQEIK